MLHAAPVGVRIKHYPVSMHARMAIALSEGISLFAWSNQAVFRVNKVEAVGVFMPEVSEQCVFINPNHVAHHAVVGKNLQIRVIAENETVVSAAIFIPPMNEYVEEINI